MAIVGDGSEESKKAIREMYGYLPNNGEESVYRVPDFNAQAKPAKNIQEKEERLLEEVGKTLEHYKSEYEAVEKEYHEHVSGLESKKKKNHKATKIMSWTAAGLGLVTTLSTIFENAKPEIMEPIKVGAAAATTLTTATLPTLIKNSFKLQNKSGTNYLKNKYEYYEQALTELANEYNDYKNRNGEYYQEPLEDGSYPPVRQEDIDRLDKKHEVVDATLDSLLKELESKRVEAVHNPEVV
ncbi:MAG: hypothetical protein KDJ35_02295 [Alphaproteobacteria bacterium]|nr:hypothetical protein [Alphaproteobacteria bacterium]